MLFNITFSSLIYSYIGDSNYAQEKRYTANINQIITGRGTEVSRIGYSCFKASRNRTSYGYIYIMTLFTKQHMNTLVHLRQPLKLSTLNIRGIWRSISNLWRDLAFKMVQLICCYFFGSLLVTSSCLMVLHLDSQINKKM